MDTPREALLQPTLGAEARPAAAPYSVQATFFTGFFGGPFAVIALIAVNAWRLRRLSRDWVVLAACLGLAILVAWLLHGSAPASEPIRDGLRGVFGNNFIRYAHRLVALLIVGIGYLLHRKEQRNTEMLGLSRPNGWIAGGLCTLGGFVLLAGLMAVGGAR